MFQDAASAAAKEFLSVAGTMDDYPFGLVSDDVVFAEYEVKGEFCNNYLCTYDLYGPCVRFLMRTDTLRGEVGGGGVALETSSFVGPCEIARAERRVQFGAQEASTRKGNLCELNSFFSQCQITIFFHLFILYQCCGTWEVHPRS